MTPTTPAPQSAGSLPSVAWVIEDSDEVFELVARILSDAGYGVIRSATKKEALQRLQMIKDVSLVVLDLKLPDGSGMAILPWITQRNDAPDVAIVTGFASMEDAVEALRMGVCDFITKPFGESDVRSMLRRVHTRQHLRIGSFVKHLASIDARFDAQNQTLRQLSSDVTALRDFVHAAIGQQKDHA